MLDDVEAVLRLDASSMHKDIESFPAQLREGMRLSEQALERVQLKAPRCVVACGMGGSGIGLDLVRAWLQPDLRAPLTVVKDYALPGYVGGQDLVYLASYSGETEETLSCLVDAARRGARFVAVSSGGRLERLSNLLDGVHVKIPAGLQPRAALGYLFTPLAVLLAQTEVVPYECLIELEDSIPILEGLSAECSLDSPAEKNPSKQLALRLKGRLPTVYGWGVFAAAAERFKQQLNENCKVFAKWEAFPELDHNEIEGFGHPPRDPRPIIVVLRSGREDEVERARIEDTLSILKGCVEEVAEVRGRGKSRICEALTTIYPCDWASFYLTCLMGQDPSPVERITRLKRALEAETDMLRRLEQQGMSLSSPAERRGDSRVGP